MINAARTTGPLIPATATDTSGGLAYWTSPNNAKVEDGNSASDFNVGPGGGAHFGFPLELTNYGFTLPTAAVIDGIKLEAKVSGTGGVHDDQIYLKYSGGTTGGSANTPNFGQFWGSSLNWLTWGGPTSLWGRTWTPAEINNAAFGAGLCGFPNSGSNTMNIDAVRITVYWHYDNAVPAADVPQRYDYKIYDPFGKFLGNLPGVTKPFSTTQALNTTGAQLSIEVAGNPDGQTPALALGRLNRWLNPAFKYRQRIRIPKGTVTADLTEMPVYVSLADMGVFFWQNVDSTGKDIRITNQYGAQELAFEIASIDSSGRTGELWFKAGSISKDFDTDFYIYYGNSAAVAYDPTSSLGRNAMWNKYAAVFHLNEAVNTTAGGYKNATGNTDGTGVSMSQAAVTGKIPPGKAADFDGVDDQITMANTFGLGTTNISLRGWANITSTNQHGAWFKIGGSNGYAIGQGNGTDMDNSGGQLMMLYEGVRWIPTGYFVATGWHQWYMTIDGSGTAYLYMDGSYVGSYPGTAPAAPTVTTYIGGYTGRFTNDPLDEVRVTPTFVSAAQVAAEYKNENTPASFYTVKQQPEKQSVEDGTTTLLRDGNLVNVYETSYYYPNGKLKFQGQINRLEAELAPEANGIIKAICHSDGRDMDNLVARGTPFTFTGDQSQASQNNRVSLITYGYGGWDHWGQTWTANTTTLGRIQLMLDGTANVTVNVYSSPGQGGGVLGTTSRFVSVGGPTVVDFTFPDLVKTVVGTQYFFEVIVDSNQSIWLHYNSSNPYAGGQMYESSYSGGSGGGGYFASTGNDLYFTTASGAPGTVVTFSNQDPTTGMLASVMTDYGTRAGNITYATGDIDATGLSLTAGFNTNTIYEVLNKILDMSPSGFYYYVDIALNKLRFKLIGNNPDYLLIRGRHVEHLTLAFSIENVINEERFSGGVVTQGPPAVNLYSVYTSQTSKALFGARLNRKSDNRVTVQGTADAIGSSDIKQFNDEQYYTTVTVMLLTMNITDIKLGQLVAFRGYGNYYDSMMLQITKIDYSPEMAVLQLGTLPLRFNRGFEDVIRGLVAEQTVSNPSTPS